MPEPRLCFCGRRFVAKARWHVHCPTCWWELRGDYDLALAEEAWRAGYVLASARAERGAAAPAVSLPILNAAIALCHPDRHPPVRFKQANEVTARLLELRDRLADDDRRGVS